MTATRKRNIILIIAIALIAVNLRPSITGVGPLISEIRIDTGLSNSMLGMLTTLPILAFGLCSLLAPVLTRRIGTGHTIAVALSLLTTGILIRIYPTFTALFLGTAVLGVGIALGNVLLPGIAKSRFPKRFGLVTGIYAAMLGLGASAASGISVPLSEGMGLGWRGALGVWAILSFIALIVWLPQTRGSRPVVNRLNLIQSLTSLGRSPLAWHVAIFMGLQSITFYVMVAWLPEVLIERGMSPVRAGWMLSLTQIVGMTATFFTPAWADRLENQKVPVLITQFMELVSVFGLMVPATSTGVVMLLVCFLGFGLGGSFGLALLFIGVRAKDDETANELSGMSQAVGYTLAAGAPALFGALRDWFDNWTVPLVFLVLVILVKTWSGWKSGENRVL
ncbi:MAG: MFS transporter [Balneolaceae bacterium]